MSDETGPVRPTKVCMDDLKLLVPTVDVPLPLVGHDLVKEAQRVPDVHAAGGVERIRVLSDRPWFKVKAGRWRGAATCLSCRGRRHDSALVEQAPWWLGAGGYRRDRSPEDFYARLAATAGRDGNSDRWLPSEWDWGRLKVEAAFAWEKRVRDVVCRLIARSLQDGRAHRADLHGYVVTALAKAVEGETYLLVGATGVADPRIFAVILNAVPGVDGDSWLPEPDRVEGLRPGPGELVWSTIVPPLVAARLLEGFGE